AAPTRPGAAARPRGRAARPQPIDRAVAQDLHADLLEDPERGAMDRLDLVRGEDLERAEGILEAPGRELTDPAVDASRAAMTRLRRHAGGSPSGVGNIG